MIIRSEPFALNPGFVWTDKTGHQHHLKEAVVKLITMGEQRAISKLKSEEERDRAFTMKSIERIGPYEVQDEMLDLMLPVDAGRIGRAIRDLAMKYRDPEPPSTQTVNECPRCRANLSIAVQLAD